MPKILGLVLILMAILSGCSARQSYESASVYAASPDAVNINLASADELEKLPHIGRKTAENIVQYREEYGRFRRPEHLIMIRGISEKRFLEIRHYIKTE